MARADTFCYHAAKIERNNVKPKHKQNRQAGFTMIELLVVIAIFAVMSSTVFASTQRSRMKARDTQRIANFRQLATALELYNAENSSYPTSMNDYGMTNFSIYPGWDGQLQADLAPYMASLPHDPNEPTSYFYYFSGPQATWCLPANGQFLRISRDRGYMLVGYLEDANNTLPQNDGGIYSDRFEVIGGDAKISATCP
jgi:prepilin-type N-terminal cleavage/methylation domain-containing protein